MSRQALLPSINDLLAFEAASRHGSFTRAAAELNLTQSAISRNIRVLEESLGTQLFERVRQKVVLTAAGSIYMQDARRILDDLRDATQRAMSFSELETVLNVAVLPTFTSRWLVPRLPSFMKSHPDVTVNFSARLQPFNFGAEPFDAAIHYGRAAWPGGVTHHLMSEVMVVVANPEYLEDHGITSPADLARGTLLHLSTRPMAWANWFEIAGLEMHSALSGPRYEQFSMLGQAAQAGLGVAILPSMFIVDELDSGDLVAPFDIELQSENAYYWVVPEDRGGSGPLHDLTEWVLNIASMPGNRF
ncbi:MAG: LysR family transcriptional regulator [Brevundimonas sp.]|uniref:LysR substrate-binding domain-containing protein n=1 Tax=Brevundimonas sp. TaxID=1871086 RepID=UPI000DB0C6BF|nr:LysR substrate-binding domain-containing protein [Brevundimonas sp.]PZT98205.1 MAG: LysR family transcriptional regulator [Brevundimonas sp.]